MDKKCNFVSGIYIIKIDKYFYIGSSNNIRKRFKRHYSELIRGTHYNKFLQRVYNKHKKYNFYLLETCKEDQLLKIEQDYIDIYYNDPNCLNLSKCVKSIMRGREFSKKHRENLSKAGKNRPVDKEHMERLRQLSIGRKWNDNQRKKCREKCIKRGKDHPFSKPVELVSTDGTVKVYNSLYDASKDLNINYRQIANWINGDSSFPASRPESQRRGRNIISGRFLEKNND